MQPPEVLCKKKSFWKFRKIHRKTPVPEPEACNFIQKETLGQVFSCEFWQISKNTFFTEHLWTTVSVDPDPIKPTSQEVIFGREVFV